MKVKALSGRSAFSIFSILTIGSSWGGLFFFKNRYSEQLLIKIWMGAMAVGFLLLLIGKIKKEQSHLWGLAMVVFAVAVMLSFAS